ncbi:unnamed protein product [Gadus morhua 'NCC']
MYHQKKEKKTQSEEAHTWAALNSPPTPRTLLPPTRSSTASARKKIQRVCAPTVGRGAPRATIGFHLPSNLERGALPGVADTEEGDKPRVSQKQEKGWRRRQRSGAAQQCAMEEPEE